MSHTYTRTYTYPRTFAGYRPLPPEEYVGKGLTHSGREADYEGVIFSDGTVVLRWCTEYKSHSVWASWDDFFHVHGHPEYGTEIVMGDGGADPLMWWLQILLGIPAVLVGLEVTRAVSPWPVTGRLSALITVALAYGVTWLPIHGHILIAADMAAVVPLLIRYLRYASSYERARADDTISRALLAWDSLRSVFPHRTREQPAGTMLPPGVGKRIPSL